MNQRPPIKLPRPNLGPEFPAPDTSDSARWVVLLVSLAAIVVWGLLWFRRRRRTKAKRSGEESHPTVDQAPIPLDQRLRATLAQQFGSPWTAYTTEEIAMAPELSDRFGDEVAERLVRFLRVSDQRRFSTRKVTGDPEDEAWAAYFLEFVVADAGTTSMINGR